MLKSVPAVIGAELDGSTRQLEDSVLTTTAPTLDELSNTTSTPQTTSNIPKLDPTEYTMHAAVSLSDTPSSIVVRNDTEDTHEIKIGLLFVKNTPEIMDYVAYQTSASAVVIAVDRLRRENKLLNYTFKYKWYFDECEEKYSVGYATSLLFNDKVDVIIGPTCPSGTSIR
uniref:ANF_receptor domain-containing protein n=1 Tax=Syphacia muris TaxID=451379 RepID=A0A0N5AUD6_9BILA